MTREQFLFQLLLIWYVASLAVVIALAILLLYYTWPRSRRPLSRSWRRGRLYRVRSIVWPELYERLRCPSCWQESPLRRIVPSRWVTRLCSNHCLLLLGSMESFPGENRIRASIAASVQTMPVLEGVEV
jgi:hypothetical protein